MTSCKCLIASVSLSLVVFKPYAQEQTPSNTNNVVMMTVSVWNKNRRHVTGLTRESFDITDENVKRSIEFFDDSDVPIRIGILVDSSGSFERRNLASLTQPKIIDDVLVRFVELGHSGNQYFMMAFNTAPKLEIDWAPKQLILSHKINYNERKTGTAMYDACFAAIEKLRTAPSAKRLLLLISDGFDDRSKRSYKELRNLLADSDVVFYGIGVYPDSPPGFIHPGQGVLDGLTELTGGRALGTKNKDEMMLAAQEIATELRHQYRIGFRLDRRDPPSKWRRIKLKVATPISAPKSERLFVRTREGYYTH